MGDDSRLAKSRKSFLIVGMGYFGAEIAARLAALGQEVVGIDADESIIQHMADKLTQAVEMDATDHDLLTTLGVSNFDICIVGRGSVLEDSVSITMSLKELGAKYLIAKAQSDRQARILQRLGVDMIVFPELDMARHVAEMLVHTGVVGEIDLGDGHIVEALKVPSRLVGQPFSKVQSTLLPKDCEVLALQTAEGIEKSPSPGRSVAEGDVLLVWARRSSPRVLEK